MSDRARDKAGQIARGVTAGGAPVCVLVNPDGSLVVGGSGAYNPAILPVGNSTTATFQAGARDWSILVLTAGVAVGGKAIPAGVTLTMPGPLASNLAVVTDGSGTALLMCNGTIA